MDPNTCLANIRKLSYAIMFSGEPFNNATNAIELAEYIRALDHWILNGGCLPKHWDTKNTFTTKPISIY